MVYLVRLKLLKPARSVLEGRVKVRVIMQKYRSRKSYVSHRVGKGGDWLACGYAA